ncbi:ATP-binding domain-containing protein [Mycobacterium camsae]|uniref:ATP-binding domain-containing protein n=1 Tax=Mycobacterium gordonae TaxID=1778 RepID=UPI00197CCA38|nr:ATP-binding domain-containing protein [Mycobacterium gordonae]
MSGPYGSTWAATVVQQVARLQSTYPQGTVAVITNMPAAIIPLLRSDPARPTVNVLTRNDARGLAFDAVVVVEPTDLPHLDRRRRGPLYTALTRPNHELVIVHTKDRPHKLQPEKPLGVRRTITEPKRAASEKAATKASKPRGRKARRRSAKSAHKRR